MNRKSGKKSDEKNSLMKELEFLKSEMLRFDNLINITDDNDLTEAYILEYKALEIKYGYIIRMARDKKINIDYIERCETNT